MQLQYMHVYEIVLYTRMGLTHIGICIHACMQQLQPYAYGTSPYAYGTVPYAYASEYASNSYMQYTRMGQAYVRMGQSHMRMHGTIEQCMHVRVWSVSAAAAATTTTAARTVTE